MSEDKRLYLTEALSSLTNEEKAWVINPEFTIEIPNERLLKPLSKQSYFVTHIVTYPATCA